MHQHILAEGLLYPVQILRRTHKLSLYSHPNGALVFGAGTVQWSWGLDDKHDRGNEATQPGHAAGNC